MNLRLGTRGSALALAQAADVVRRLEARGHTVRIEVISTTGDRVNDRAFSAVGAFGVFVREIETALLQGAVDVAVHSYKDLPSTSPDGLDIAAVPERLDPADLLLVRAEALALGGLLPVRAGATVGTSSARRYALLRAARPDLTIALLRGNVPTRLSALMAGRYDAIVLAAAGVARLERRAEIAPLHETPNLTAIRLDPAVFVPAPAQGAIAVQIRRDDDAVRRAVAAIDDPRVARALRAERAILARAEGGCQLPFGAWCEVEEGGGDALRLRAVLGGEDGTIERAEGRGRDPDALADEVWQMLQQSGRPA